MIPSSTRQGPPRKDRLQQARRRRGADWEALLILELNHRPDTWAVLLPKSWAGQPFDITAVQAGRGMAVECKRILRGNLPYSCFTANEKEHLSRFEDAGGLALVAVYRDSDRRRVFVPWQDIREDVLGGVRGSVQLEKYPGMLLTEASAQAAADGSGKRREEAAPCK